MARSPLNHRKRQKVFEKDSFKCVYCGKEDKYCQLEVDHIIPISNGGSNDLSNLQTTCYECNMLKRFGKIGQNSEFNKLRPLQQLEIIRNRLAQYSNLNIESLRVMFSLDPLLRKCNIPREDLLRLFIKDNNLKKEEKSNIGKKYLEQRDMILYLLRKNTKFTYQELSNMLLDYDIEMSYVQISRICAKFGDKSEELKEK